MNRKGFTLIELTVAVMIFLIFILAVGTILTSSWRFWNDGWEQVRLQRDASYAFARIEKVVRDASEVSNDPDGGSTLELTKDTAGEQWDKTFKLTNDVLYLEESSGSDAIIEGVQEISFSDSGNMVIVELILETGSADTGFRTAIFLRNSS
jgi:prepilin-type N-terminal cleavage/methylation domain-containing protein